jgi:hypothetical protein
VGQHCCRRAFELRVLQQRRLPAASKAEAAAAPAAEAIAVPPLSPPPIAGPSAPTAFAAMAAA